MLRVSTILAAVALIFALCGVVNQMLQSEEDYQAMLDHVNTVYESLEFSIDAVADEMDEKFRQNNSLTVDYQIQHLSTDIEANTATFQLYAIPKTFVPGMTAVFQARSRENVVELTAESDGEGAFSGTLTCPLSDDISLFVTFVTGRRSRPSCWRSTTLYIPIPSPPLPFRKTLPTPSRWTGRTVCSPHLRETRG